MCSTVLPVWWTTHESGQNSGVWVDHIYYDVGLVRTSDSSLHCCKNNKTVGAFMYTTCEYIFTLFCDTDNIDSQFSSK